MSDSPNFRRELTGAFGDPIDENPTQAMIEPAYRSLGLSWRYLTVLVRRDGLADAVRGARAMHWRGFNCTIPHKVAVIEHLDETTPAAAAIGAVNCVTIQNGKLIGENTDGKGFLQALSTIRPASGLRVAILGAGGAARAIGVELALAGASQITIVNRSADRAGELVRNLERKTPVSPRFIKWDAPYAVPREIDVLINATSLGLYPDVDTSLPIDLAAASRDLIVCDVIPNPPRTRLIRDAETAGFRTLDGLGMLINQGAIAIKLWTGLEPDRSVMRSALETIFSAGSTAAEHR